MKTVVPCGVCMCKWICGSCNSYDARSITRQPPGLGNPCAIVASRSLAGVPDEILPTDVLPGMQEVARLAKLSPTAVASLSTELKGLGAAHAEEVTVADWQALAAWGSLRTFEKRRLLTAIRQLLSE